MPRLVRSLPRYRRHRASRQAVVTLNGRDYYLGPYGTKASKFEYDRLIGEWLAGGRNPLHVTAAELTVVELCARYLKFADGHYHSNPKVMPGIKRTIRYLREQYSHTAAREFGPLALKAIRQGMVEEGLSRRYINDHADRIKRMFKWAVGEQLLPVEVYQSLCVVPGLRKGRTKARECEPVLPVEDATVDATLPHLPEVVADMVRVQRLTGMRPAEVCILRPCDIDRSVDPWRYVPKSHKTEHKGRERLIFVGPQAQGILLRYLARDAESNCFRPCDSEAKRRAAAHASRRTPLNCGHVPGSNRRRKPKRTPGKQYSVDAYRQAIHRACDAAFLPVGELAQRSGETVKAWHGRLTDQQSAELAHWQSEHRWSPNQLRHTAATDIRRRYGLEAAATVLGHARADVTQIYAERDYALAANVARQIG
jgi:integrase